MLVIYRVATAAALVAPMAIGAGNRSAGRCVKIIDRFALEAVPPPGLVERKALNAQSNFGLTAV